jgi:hypothetical protein
VARRVHWPARRRRVGKLLRHPPLLSSHHQRDVANGGWRKSLSTLQSKRHFQRAALRSHWCAGSWRLASCQTAKIGTRGIDVGTEPLYAKVVDQRRRKRLGPDPCVDGPSSQAFFAVL